VVRVGKVFVGFLWLYFVGYSFGGWVFLGFTIWGRLMFFVDVRSFGLFFLVKPVLFFFFFFPRKFGCNPLCIPLCTGCICFFPVKREGTVFFLPFFFFFCVGFF